MKVTLTDVNDQDPVRRRIAEAREKRKQHARNAARARYRKQLDDEPVTPEDERAIEEARDQARRGEVLTTDELMWALLGCGKER